MGWLRLAIVLVLTFLVARAVLWHWRRGEIVWALGTLATRARQPIRYGCLLAFEIGFLAFWIWLSAMAVRFAA